MSTNNQYLQEIFVEHFNVKYSISFPNSGQKTVKLVLVVKERQYFLIAG